ncbi:hypothetical protein [Nocardia sp. NPDC005825]|uniref:hypothetical protein n=1 Tax=unclassified Nocardia TaxID=2637762 RepID=UPI003408675D
MVYFKWFGTAFLAVLSLVVGLVPFVHSWPRWVFVAIGVAAVVACFFMFPWGARSGAKKPDQTNSVRQTLTTGNHSRSIQSAGDVTVEGGMGDTK